MKTAKYLLIGFAVLVVLAIAGAAIFAMTFDPNRYRGEIERVAKERTGRTLKLQGPLELAFFPSLGARVSKVTFSEHGSDQEFLSLDSAHASVEVMPLIRGQVVVDKIRVAGLKARIVKDKAGRYNFQDLIESAEKNPTPPSKGGPAEKKAEQGKVNFDIAGLDLERSAISYKDLSTGRELALSELKLATGRIAKQADGKLQFSTAVKGANPTLDAKVNLGADYRYDLAAKSYALSKLDGAVKGTVENEALEARISAPRVDIAADQATGEAVTAEFSMKGAKRSTEARLKLGGVQGSAKALVFPSINADISLSGPDLPKAVKLPISGSARVDLEKQTMNADLTSKFDESNIQAKLGLAKFSPAAYTFDINVDRLNLDQYFPPKAAAKPAAPAPEKKEGGKAAPAPQAEDTPIDLSAIKDLNANGRLQFGALQVKGLKLANVKTQVRAANGRMEVGPHSAGLYEGALAGTLSLQAAGNRVALKETLTNVSVGPLLRDAAHQDRLEGRGNVALDVSGEGATVNTLKKSLDGSAKVNLRDGAIKGVDIGGLLNKVKSLGKSEEGSANTKEETKFTELNATFTIKNGVASNKDLDVKAPLLRIGGAGDIDIGGSTINYVVKGSVVATSKGQGGAGVEQLSGLTVPVKLSGPFDALKYQVDYGAVAGDLAKSKVGEKVKEGLDKNKDKIEDKVRDRLKGLLGR
jgi:AsmA protein